MNPQLRGRGGGERETERDRGREGEREREKERERERGRVTVPNAQHTSYSQVLMFSEKVCSGIAFFRKLRMDFIRAALSGIHV